MCTLCSLNFILTLHDQDHNGSKDKKIGINDSNSYGDMWGKCNLVRKHKSLGLGFCLFIFFLFKMIRVPLLIMS